MKFITLFFLIILVIGCGSVPNNTGYYPYTVEKVSEDIYLIEARGTSLSTEVDAREQWDLKADSVCQGSYKYLTKKEYRKYKNKSRTEIISKYGCKDSLDCIQVSFVTKDSGDIKYPKADGAAICMLANNESSETLADTKVNESSVKGKSTIIGIGGGAGGFLKGVLAGPITGTVEEALIKQVDGKDIKASKKGPEYWLTPGKHEISYICSRIHGHGVSSGLNTYGKGSLTVALEDKKTYKLIPYDSGSGKCKVRLESL